MKPMAAKTKFSFSDLKPNREKARKYLLGSKDREGIIPQVVKYVLLIGIGFIYIYPLLYMISTSLMPLEDLLDTSVHWIPSQLYLENYRKAMNAMKFFDSLLDSIVIAGIPTLIQMVVCAFVGYGFARFDFKGKKIMMAILIFSFILPPQITMMPTYVLYTDLKLIGSVKSFIFPAILGQGLKSQIFILIYYQFFRQVPQALIEAALIDGAGYFKSFLRIAVPSAGPAILVVFLFSVVWYWNESYLATLYITGTGSARNTSLATLVVQLKNFDDNYQAYNQSGQEQMGNINESIKMAGTMLSILPLLLMYAFMQKQFVESVDRTGITGE